MLKNFYYHTEQLIKNKNKVKIFTEYQLQKNILRKGLIMKFKTLHKFIVFIIDRYQKNYFRLLGETRIDKVFQDYQIL